LSGGFLFAAWLDFGAIGAKNWLEMNKIDIKIK
jgi:hypothetical protein